MPSVVFEHAATPPGARRPEDSRFFGDRYFLHLIGPPSLALAATSLASVALPQLRPHLALFCHQIEPRTICLHGAPMGLCARCTGIYLGIAGVWLGLEWLARRPALLRAVEPVCHVLAGVSMLLYVAGVDVGNAMRLAFGLALGKSATLLVWRIRRWLLRRRASAGRAST